MRLSHDPPLSNLSFLSPILPPPSSLLCPPWSLAPSISFSTIATISSGASVRVFDKFIESKICVLSHQIQSKSRCESPVNQCNALTKHLHRVEIQSGKQHVKIRTEKQPWRHYSTVSGRNHRTHTETDTGLTPAKDRITSWTSKNTSQ